jgi:hypothetical protein
MFRKLRPRSVYDVFALLALIVAVGGTSAYAANTIGSTDIIDGQVKSVDIGDGEVNSADVKDQSLTTFDVSTFLGADIVDGSLTGADVATDSLSGDDIYEPGLLFHNTITANDIGTGAVGSDEVTDNSLTGADINESTLNLPQTPTTATFAGPSSAVNLNNDGSFTKVVGKNLPAGSWAITATANLSSGVAFTQDNVRDAVCELRNGSGFIGGAADRRVIPDGDFVKRSLSMNGGAQVPAGGGEVSLWCKSQGAFETVDYGQMMIIRLDGFS